MSDTQGRKPSELIRPERREALTDAFSRRYGNPEVFIAEFDMIFGHLAELFGPEVTDEDKAALLAGWFEYHLGLRPRDQVHPELLEVLDV